MNRYLFSGIPMAEKRKYRKQTLDEEDREKIAYISRLFREHRIWEEWSQKTVAEENNLSRSFIERSEKLNNNPTLKSIILLSNIYGITLEELFTGVN